MPEIDPKNPVHQASKNPVHQAPKNPVHPDPKNPVPQASKNPVHQAPKNPDHPDQKNPDQKNPDQKKPEPKKPTRKKSKKTVQKEIVLKEEPLRSKKEILNEDFFRKVTKNLYLDIYVLASNKVVDHFKIKDIGQDWIKSTKLNRSYLVPDRSEGYMEGFKTMFFYDAANISPLTQEDKNEIDKQNVVYTFARFSENKIKRFNFYLNANIKHYQKYDEKTQQITTVVLQPTTIDSALLERLINTDVVTKFLKIPSTIWEDLKVPIIAACIALTVIVMLITM